MKFQDKWSRWHHKPIKEGKVYSSGNGWVYTAECKAMGLSSDTEQLSKCFKASLTKYGFSRHPDAHNVGISHDEVIGAFACFQGTDVMKESYHKWESQGWQICDVAGFKPVPWLKLDWYGVLKDFYEIYKLDKLYNSTGGKEGIKARHSTLLFPRVFPIAFHMGGWKRYLIKKHYGVRPTVGETFKWFVSKLVTIYTKEITPGKRILGFQLKLLRNKSVLDKILEHLFNKRNNLKQIVAAEYHKDHPILEKL
jgi:hypothetical protein